MKKNNENTEVVLRGEDALNAFIPHLLDKALAITTPCERFAVIQLGRFDKGSNISAASLVNLNVGGDAPQHKHDKSDATFYFLSGEGYVILGDDRKRVPYKTGSVVSAPRSVLHGFEPTKDGLMLSLQVGEPIVSDDGTMDIEYVDPQCFSEHGTVGG